MKESIISELSEEQKYHITLIVSLMEELVVDKIITPTQKDEIKKYISDKIATKI